MGAVLQGRRVEWRPGFTGGFGGAGRGDRGDYCLVPPAIDPRGDGVWYVIDPDNRVGAIVPSVHQVREHDDGTITVQPSLACRAADGHSPTGDIVPSAGKEGWHGWLRAGVWESV
jgi:hypothetical protein